MSIDTYAELQTHIRSRLARGDIDDLVPIFIAEAEKRIAASVSIQAMETALSLTLLDGNATVSMPSGFLRLQGSIYRFEDDTRTALTELPVEMFHQLYKDVTTEGSPTAFYVTAADALSFNYTADKDYTIIGTYYKMLTLSDTDTTNWILVNFPMALVYGAMFEALLYTNDDPRTYAAMFDEQIFKMRRYNNNKRNRYGARSFTQVAL